MLDWQLCKTNTWDLDAHHSIYKGWLLHRWSGLKAYCMIPLEASGRWGKDDVRRFLERFPFWQGNAHPDGHNTCNTQPGSQSDACCHITIWEIERVIALIDRTEKETWAAVTA